MVGVFILSTAVLWVKQLWGLCLVFSLQHHWALHDELWRRLHRSHRQDSYCVGKKGSRFRRSDHQLPPVWEDDAASLMRWWILGVMIQGEDADTEANGATSLATIRAELSESWDATGKDLKPLFDRMQILINSLQNNCQEEKQKSFFYFILIMKDVQKSVRNMLV